MKNPNADIHNFPNSGQLSKIKIFLEMSVCDRDFLRDRFIHCMKSLSGRDICLEH